MPGTRIVIDGLWRCLCPSLDEAALSRALRTPSTRLQPLPPRTPRRRSTTCVSLWRTRKIHTTVRRCDGSAAAVETTTDNPLPNLWRQDDSGDDKPVTAHDILIAPEPPRDLLVRAPTSVLYDVLRAMQTQPKRRPHIRALVKYLVEKRSQTPNAFLYEALIASNWEPAGSAEEVRQVLDEMRDLGVATTSSLCHTALRALAVHPDYLLRNRIVSEMRERWFEISQEGRISIALGLLRDGQRELALDKLEALLDDPSHSVPTWVLDIFIVVLTQHAHFDEALALLQRRATTQSSSPSPASLPLNIWSLLLDECSRAYHYPGVRLAWDALVPHRLLNPSDGICLNVLNTASRHSDAQLCQAVISHLSSRNVKLGVHHYEALVDCHAHRDDVTQALEALCAMSLRGGVRPGPASTASISAAFRRNPSLAKVGRDALLRLAETSTVPLAAFNVVLEGLCGLSGDRDDDGMDAFDLYQQVRHLCGCGPDAYTFRPFMERGWDLSTSKFLLDEMRAFGVTPTLAFYDRLVSLAAVEGDLDYAFEALADMEGSDNPGEKTEGKVSAAAGKKKWITRETALAVVRRCVAGRDERVWELLRLARGVGLDLGPAGRALEGGMDGMREEWKREREPGEVAAGKDETVGVVEETESEEGVQRRESPWLGDPFLERREGSDAGTG